MGFLKYHFIFVLFSVAAFSNQGKILQVGPYLVAELSPGKRCEIRILADFSIEFFCGEQPRTRMSAPEIFVQKLGQIYKNWYDSTPDKTKLPRVVLGFLEKRNLIRPSAVPAPLPLAEVPKSGLPQAGPKIASEAVPEREIAVDTHSTEPY